MTRAMFLLTAMLAFLSFGVSAESTWGEEQDDEPKTFHQLDLNGDGKLEESEVLEVQDDHDFEGVEFDTLDEDDNGEVSNDEWDEYFRQD
jgi:Ca2+-binding EF-hand superfamily protein